MIQFLERIRATVGDFIDDVKGLIWDVLRVFRASLGSFGEESSRSLFNQYFRSVESQLCHFLEIVGRYLDSYYRGVNRMELRDELQMGIRLQQQASMLLGYVLDLTLGVIDRCSRFDEPAVIYPESDTDTN